MPLGGDWTEERVEALKKFWADGLSASMIAAELGGITRNAVIGKVDRLGLRKREARVPQIRKQRAPTRVPRMVPRPLISGNLALQADLEAVADPRPQQRPADVVPIAKRLGLSALTARSCRWPIGDPRHADFGFCGHEAERGKPYCGHHLDIAYPNGAPS